MRIERGLLLFLTITAHCSAFFVPSGPLLARARDRLSGRIAVRACTDTEPEPVTISHPDTAAPALWVVPAGYEGTKKPPTGAVDLVVSTKEAWGDGYHPTTALGLEFLVKHVGLSTQQLLDYGTGSGVLGIAACRLGCQNVVGVDIDDEALDEAAVNVLENHIPADHMRLVHTREVIQDLDGIVLRDDPAAGAMSFDLVVANILVGPLMKLAPVLSLACKVGGRLMLSGLRIEHVDAIQLEYAKYGIEFDQMATKTLAQWRQGAEGEGEWALISG